MKYANIDELIKDVERTCAFLDHFHDELDDFGRAEYEKFQKTLEFIKSL